MESLASNETYLTQESHENNSTDWSYWESLSPDYAACFWEYDFEFKNMTLQLHQWGKLKKLLMICEDTIIVRRVAFWLSLAIGIPGNILALLTILQFPKTTGTFYLALLSISDWTALIAKAMNVGMITFRLYDAVSCKLIILLTDFTATYANWILVLICFERLVTILYPLKKSYYFTLRRARYSALLLAFILFIFYSVYLWIITVNDYGCTTNYEDFFNSWSHGSTALYSYLPSVLLIIMVLLIWRALRNIQRNREYIFCGAEGDGAAGFTQQRLQYQARMEWSITLMLLFACIAFILLTLPLCVIIAINSAEVINPTIANKVYLELAFVIARGLVALSHAVNFFIYFVSTERFRTHLFKLLKCPRLTGRHTTHDRSCNTVEDQL